ncbi:UTP-glucose-1-phosphate uridylyltransferase [Acidimicrobium ferrooxidans DSM 10331]|uniref:UTP--glucose-1-phosphate uridylyltransferase n=1 Tax=Acidimicrobium ferrooxidans (strain DSM 10331 / JCM 15462 / NBRC 103882 / ICP) TaxID=525909 RepID=C7M360_ACIFD|nr:UTP--glucose-1-phosphate uridylyltransferase GalU [Acidimicrobium ferrooxidans]ACU53454.1 UTP-glucose-1-phosphate uridylyltransferase [Acidimicrobium ferrooxidans DSM 10331]
MLTKVVIPAAGLGTRFLPATKAQPKEMLPVVDQPAIQYVVEEAVTHGLTNILVVTGRGKRSIEDHFDRAVELELLLARQEKFAELALVEHISHLGQIHYLRQGEPRGLGHAVSVAAQHVGRDPFVVMLADDIMGPASPLLADMLALHERTGASVLSLMEVPPERIRLYGAAGVVDEDGVDYVRSVVEKPDASEAPSNLAITGRYIFTPAIFDALAETPPGKGGEIQLTDAIARLIEHEPVVAVRFDGRHRYDIGDKLDYLRSVVELALQRPDLGPALRRVLTELLETTEEDRDPTR